MSLDHPDQHQRESFIWSVKLFHYWDAVRKPTFEWEVVDLPSFLAFHITAPDKSGSVSVTSVPLIVQSRRLHTLWSGEVVEDMKAYGREQSLRELERITLDSITNEMEEIYSGTLRELQNQIKLFVYMLMLTPTLFDFIPHNGFFVRCAFQAINKDEKFVGNNKLLKHNYSVDTYKGHKFTPYSWNDQLPDNLAPTELPPPEIIDELMKEYQLKASIRAIKERMGYKIVEELESIDANSIF